MNIVNFIASLKYMGIGLVGIFVIISIIILLINLLIKAFPASQSEE